MSDLNYASERLCNCHSVNNKMIITVNQNIATPLTLALFLKEYK